MSADRRKERVLVSESADYDPDPDSTDDHGAEVSIEIWYLPGEEDVAQSCLDEVYEEIKKKLAKGSTT